MAEIPLRTPTADEMNQCLRRAAHERSEAFASVVRWLRAHWTLPASASMMAKQS